MDCFTALTERAEPREPMFVPVCENKKLETFDMLRSLRKLVIVTIICFVATGVAYSADQAAPADKPAAPKSSSAKEAPAPKNAAIVNGKPITYSSYALELELVQRRLQSHGQIPTEADMPKLRSDVIDEMINIELLYQDSQKQGIKIDPKKIEEEIDQIRKRYPDSKQFESALAEMKMSEKMLKDQFARRSSIQTLIDRKITPGISISDDEIKKFYDDNPTFFEQPEQVHARHILIKVDENASSEAKEEAKKKITDIKKRIVAGEDFAELAKAHSQCPSSSKGGDLGFFGKGQMVPEFEQKAFSMKADEVSDVVETKFGYHLIKVIEHKESGKVAFETAKPKISNKLRNDQTREKLLAHVAELRKEAKIETFVK